MPKRPENLDPVHDKRVIGRYLEFVKDFEEPIHCILEEKELPFECRATAVDTEKLEVSIEPITASAPELWKEHQDAVERKILVQFQAQDVVFFADAKISRPGGKDNLKISLEVPVWKLQRRSALRLRVIDSMECKTKLKGRDFVPDDISAGGFSILVDAEEAVLFNDGERIDGVPFAFKGRKHTIETEVTSHARPRKDGMIRIGFKFVKPPAALESEIAREAYWFNQKVWGKRI